MQEIGTLAELDVKPGDVVQYRGDPTQYVVAENHRVVDADTGELFNYDEAWGKVKAFRIVSRATPAEPDGITWGEWGPMLSDDIAADRQMQVINGKAQWRYPVPKQPVVETVTMWGGDYGVWTFDMEQQVSDTARITFETKDGEPDWSTLRGEDLA